MRGRNMAFETTTRPVPVPTELRWLEDYPGLRRAWAECAAPSSEDELRAVLRWAAREGRTVTLRGGGQCLHGQSVGDDLVVDVSALDHVHVDLERGVVTAGAGARWEDVRAALPPGWVLPNLVTTGAASVGGTLVADAASRFSSAFGREADGARRVRLMTADGATLECDREGPHAELFAALPGSVGLLGAVLSVEHALVDLRHLLAGDGRRGAPSASLRVRTVARKHPHARSLVADLALELRAPRSQRCPRGAYGLVIPGRGALLFHSTYTREPRGRRMMNHRRRDPLRVIFEKILHVPTLNRALWSVIFAHYYSEGDTFVDDAEDFAFFMDVGTTARALAARLGLSTTLVQQVVELPFDAGAAACAAASALLEGCERLCRVHEVRPVGWDVVAIRSDVPGRSHALRFSTAVALQSATGEDRARALLGAQATLAADHGARVLLGKGVYAGASTLAATMGAQLATLRRLKGRWDPAGRFGGPFYEQVILPAMSRATGAAPSSEARASMIACTGDEP